MNNRDWIGQIADDDMWLLREALSLLLNDAIQNNRNTLEEVESLAWDFGLNVDAARGPVGVVTP